MARLDAYENSRPSWVCDGCQTSAEKAPLNSLRWESRPKWAELKHSGLWTFAVIGVIAGVGVSLEQVNLIVELGFDGWLDRDISGADFLLTLALPVAALVLIVAAVADWLGDRDSRKRQRRG